MILLAHLIPLFKLGGVHEAGIQLASLSPQLLILPPPKILVLLLLGLLLQLGRLLSSTELLRLSLLDYVFNLERKIVVGLLFLLLALLTLLHTLGEDVHEVILLLLHLDLHLVVDLGSLLQHGLLDRILTLQFVLVCSLQLGIKIPQSLLHLLPISHLVILAAGGGFDAAGVAHWLQVLGRLMVLLFFLHRSLVGNVTITSITSVIIVHLLGHEEVLRSLLPSSPMQVLLSSLIDQLHLLLVCLLLSESLLGLPLVLRLLVVLHLVMAFHVPLQSVLHFVVQILKLVLRLPVTLEALCEHVFEILLLGLQLLLLLGENAEPSTPVLALAVEELILIVGRILAGRVASAIAFRAHILVSLGAVLGVELAGTYTVIAP